MLENFHACDLLGRDRMSNNIDLKINMEYFSGNAFIYTQI